MTKDSSNNYHHRLHALDLVTHADLNGGPTEVQASVSGTATGSVGGTVTFVPSQYKERASLLLLGGTIYTTWASNCDDPNYTGWVIGYSEASLQRQSVLNVTANGTTQGGKEGGIWMAGSGPAADSAGAIYLLVGNGTFDTTLNGGGFPINSNYGNAFLKLTASGNNLTVADYFVMHNACCTGTSESNQDTDLGSGRDASARRTRQLGSHVASGRRRGQGWVHLHGEPRLPGNSTRATTRLSIKRITIPTEIAPARGCWGAESGRRPPTSKSHRLLCETATSSWRFRSPMPSFPPRRLR